MSDDISRLEERLAQANKHLESVQAAVADAERQMHSFTASVVSKDGSVEVTVGSQGELTGLKFLDGKYRSMPAAQLADAVLEAVQEARSHFARTVRDLFEPLTRPGENLPDLPGMEIDWDRIVGPAAEALPEEPVARSASDRLRDEIHEDDEDGGPGGGTGTEPRRR